MGAGIVWCYWFFLFFGLVLVWFWSDPPLRGWLGLRLARLRLAARAAHWYLLLVWSIPLSIHQKLLLLQRCILSLFIFDGGFLSTRVLLLLLLLLLGYGPAPRTGQIYMAWHPGLARINQSIYNKNRRDPCDHACKGIDNSRLRRTQTQCTR